MIRATKKRVLLLGGTFSGTTRSLAIAFERAGCVVEHQQPTLRALKLRPLYILAIGCEAGLLYGFGLLKHLSHTRTAHWAYGKAKQRMIEKLEKVDIVIELGANGRVPDQHYRAGVRYILYTDHTNQLSKKSPALGFDAPEKKTRPFWNRLEADNLRKYDHISVMGSHVKQSMVVDYRVPETLIDVVGAAPNVDVDIGRDKVPKDFFGKNILFVGLDAKRKGLRTLIEAFRRLQECHPEARLHIVGSYGQDTESVKYYGRISGNPLRDLYYRCQVFAMPTMREPFGIVFLEAMWSMTVCVGTDVGAIPEIIQDGQTGYIVPPNDPDALAHRIGLLLECPERMQRMAAAAYDQAREHWSWARVVQAMLR